MEITKNLDGDRLTLAVVGRLETTTAPLLDAEIRNTPAAVTALTIDLTEVEYVSSAGLRTILVAHKTMSSRGGTMALAGVNENVRRVLTLTGFAPLLTFA